jgi:dCTP diphosphatase
VPRSVGEKVVENLSSSIRRFVGERDWEQFHSPKNLAMALSVEVSEIVEHFQWLTQEQSRNLPPEKLREVAQEIGDVMIYLIELSDALGVDPITAATEKVNANSSKYPVDLVRGKAAKYTGVPAGRAAVDTREATSTRGLGT